MVSVIVPVYNTERFLPRCVESLLNQTLKGIEIILVNDASPDNSINIMKSYQKKYPDKIKLIDSKVNLRQGGARNLGLKISTGEYIGFVDSDDWVAPEMFKSLYDKALKDGSDMIGSQYFSTDSSGNIKLYKNKYTEEFLNISGKFLKDIQKEQLLFKINGIWSHLYKRSIIFENNIFFPEHTAYEDNYFVRIYTLYIKKYSFLNESFYFYYKNLNSTVNKKNENYHFDRLEIERKKIKEYKIRGVFEKYKQGIELDFLKTFYINTLALSFNLFDSPDFKLIKSLKEELKNYFPEYKHNVYYKTDINIQDKLKILLFEISPRLLYYIYLIKNKFKKD